jgi:hypothetical protein
MQKENEVVPLSLLGKSEVGKGILFHLHILPNPKCYFNSVPCSISLDPAAEATKLEKKAPKFKPLFSLEVLKTDTDLPYIVTYTPSILLLRIVPTNLIFDALNMTLTAKGNSRIATIHSSQDTSHTDENEDEKQVKTNMLSFSFKVEQPVTGEAQESKEEPDRKTITLTKHGIYIPFMFQASQIPIESINISCDFINTVKQSKAHYYTSVNFHTRSPLSVHHRTCKVHSNGMLAQITITNKTAFPMENVTVEVQENESYIVEKAEYSIDKVLYPDEAAACVFAFEVKSLVSDIQEQEVCSVVIKYRQNGNNIVFTSLKKVTVDVSPNESKQTSSLSLIGVPERIRVLEHFSIKVDVHNSSNEEKKFLLRLKSEGSSVVPIGKSSFETNILASHESQRVEMTFCAIRQGLHTFPPFQVTALSPQETKAVDLVPEVILMENGILVTN